MHALLARDHGPTLPSLDPSPAAVALQGDKRQRLQAPVAAAPAPLPPPATDPLPLSFSARCRHARGEASRRGATNVQFLNPGLDDEKLPQEGTFELVVSRAGRRLTSSPRGTCREQCKVPNGQGRRDAGGPFAQHAGHANLRASRPHPHPLCLCLQMTHDAIHDIAHPQAGAWACSRPAPMPYICGQQQPRRPCPSSGLLAGSAAVGPHAQRAQLGPWPPPPMHTPPPYPHTCSHEVGAGRCEARGRVDHRRHVRPGQVGRAEGEGGGSEPASRDAGSWGGVGWGRVGRGGAGWGPPS